MPKIVGKIEKDKFDISTSHKHDGVDAPKLNVLYKDNKEAFTPKNDYEPATKKYVDDNKSQVDLTEVDRRISSAVEELETDLTNQISEVEEELAFKANSSDVYTTNQVDEKVATLETNLSTAIGLKADKSNTYTKTEIDTKVDTINNTLGLKADKTNTYNKTEVDEKISTINTDLENKNKDIENIEEILDTKADKANTYLNTEIDAKVNTINNTITTLRVDTETELATKANVEDVYTKTEIDKKETDLNTVIDKKADKATLNEEVEKINTELDTKADKSTTYTKTEVDTKISDLNTTVSSSLSSKADTENVYTKTEVDTNLENTRIALDEKIENIKETTYTKEEIDTSLSSKANTSSVYNKTEIDNKLSTVNNNITNINKEIDTLETNLETLETTINTDLSNKADKSTTYTKTEIDTKVATINTELAEIDTIIATKADKSTTYNKTEVDTKVSNLNTSINTINTTLATKANVSDVYNKNEVDTKVNNLANNVYTKAQVDEKISKVYKYQGSVAKYSDLPTNANEGDVYNVEETGKNYAWTGTSWDDLGGMIDTSNLVEKDEVPTKVSQLENDAGYITEIPDIPTKVSELENDSGYLTSIPNTVAMKTDIPTKTSQLTNNSGFLTSIPSTVANKSDIPTKVSQLTNDSGYLTEAPDAIDNLTSTSTTDALSANQGRILNNNKVDKVSGKGLSTNDYTTTEKNKLAGIAEGANKYVLPVASDTALGGVKIGNEIKLDENSYLVTDWRKTASTGGTPPVDSASIDDLHGNRLAHLPAEYIDIKYSNDGGTTWVDYGAADYRKVRLVTTSDSFAIGATSSKATIDDKLQITITAKVGIIYMSARKILLNVTTNGAGGSNVTLETRTVSDTNNEVDNWTKKGTYNVSGWSGWNAIPFPVTLGGSGGSHVGQIRLTFGITSVSETSNSNLTVLGIRLIAPQYWSAPSNMARNGHLYTYDQDQVAFFPNRVNSATAPINSGDLANKGYVDAQKFSGKYSDLTGTPTIPTKTSQLTNDSNLVEDSSYVHTDTNFTQAEKTKLAGIAEGANKTVVDSALSSTSTNPVQNKVINTALAGKANSSHSHDAATTSAAGFMSTADKTKLDGIATGATKVIVDSAVSDTSTNAIQNKVIKKYVDDNCDAVPEDSILYYEGTEVPDGYEQVDDYIMVTGDTLPVGTVVEYSGETVPENWVEVSELTDSTLVSHGTGGAYSRRTLADYLPKGSTNSAFYSTNYLQLGYISCELSQESTWGALCLSIMNTFYGVQHWSSNIISLAVAHTVKPSQLYLGGDSRTFYYNIDTTNKRVYLYAYCTGGNGFGNWVISVLNRWQCNWTTDIVHGVTREDTWQTINAV